MEHLSVMTAPTLEGPTSALGGGPGFVVELEAFSGPLDLLLHLLREEQLEIADIQIARIADQFLQVPFANSYVDRVNRSCSDPDKNFIVRWLRSRHVLKLHHFRATVGMNDNGPHLRAFRTLRGS